MKKIFKKKVSSKGNKQRETPKHTILQIQFSLKPFTEYKSKQKKTGKAGVEYRHKIRGGPKKSGLAFDHLYLLAK